MSLNLLQSKLDSSPHLHLFNVSRIEAQAILNEAHRLATNNSGLIEIEAATRSRCENAQNRLSALEEIFESNNKAQAQSIDDADITGNWNGDYYLMKFTQQDRVVGGFALTYESLMEIRQHIEDAIETRQSIEAARLQARQATQEREEKEKKKEEARHG